MVGATNYDQVRGFWSSNVWNLKSMAGGTGVVRPITIDAGTATLTATGATVQTTATTAQTNATNVNIFGTSQILLSSGGSPSPDIYISPSDVNLRSNITLASASNAALDAVKFNGSLGLTGSSHVTTPQYFNNFAQPTINAGGAVDTAATVYISGPPLITGVGSSLGSSYPLYVGSGVARFDGDGSGNVFEVPSHGCGACVATVPDGRIPVLITGVGVRYIRYFTN
jgi:hypothetical protein